MFIKNNSNNCQCFFTTTSNMFPHININMAIVSINPANGNVGYLGTNPVLKYSINTGVPNIRRV